MRGRWMTLLAVAMAMPALAGDPTPEISRPAATAQPVGVLHTLRQIPEACARIQGRFTGNAAEPYKFELVKTSPNCAPRAKLVDAAKARPSEAAGWKFNDLVRVPSTRCATQFAVVRVWRKAVGVAPPKLDAPLAPPTAPKVVDVRFYVDSEPQGATVLRDGVKLGVTPFSLTLQRKDAAPVQLDLSYELDGYEPLTVSAKGLEGAVSVSHPLKKKPDEPVKAPPPTKAKTKNPKTTKQPSDTDGFKDDPY